MQAPPQEDEARRLVALRSYHVLDTPQERRYDEITALAAEICETSVALITLIDAERQWVKSQVGFDRREIPRRDSFCAHALRSSGLFIVPDTVEDERFAHNPLVTGAPGIRFYAGAPLITPGGQTLGTLCVLDVQPRTLNAVQLRALEALSHSVMEKMELQREVVEEQRVSALLRDSEERYRLLFEQNPNAMWAYDLETLRFLCVNDAAIARYGFSREEFLDMTISDIRPKEDVADLLGYVARTSEGIHQSGVWRHRLRNGEIIQVDITSHSFDYPGCRARMVVASDVTDRHLAEEQLREVTRLTALRADVASCLSSEFTLPDIFQYCSELLLSHLDATFVGLWLQDPVARVLTLSASAGCEPPARQQCLMRIAASGQPELSSDLAANPAFDDPEWLARHELVAFAGYPIDLEGTVHGVLAIFSRRRFSEAILQELSPITNGLAQRLKRQLAEDQLRRSEASLLHAQEIARLGNWDWNIQTGKLYWSPQVFELVGIAPHEFTGEYEAFRQRVHPDDLERVELA
ncbi:MAG TPA: GAF domain-containing protein, partial [Chthoniobacterales bacterium]